MCHIAGIVFLETGLISASLRICHRAIRREMTREASPGMIVAEYVIIFLQTIGIGGESCQKKDIP